MTLLKTVPLISGLTGEAERAVRQALNDLIAEVNRLQKEPRLTPLQIASYNAREGEIVRIQAGLTLNLPRARLENRNAEIGCLLETEGTLTVTSTGDPVTGAVNLVDNEPSIEITRQGLTFFRSNGSTGWFSTGRGESVTGADIVAADFDWESTLSRGNTAGLFNPFIPAGQFIGFGVEGSLPAAGNIRSSANWHINVTGDIVQTASAELRFNGPGGVAIEAVATPQTAIGAGDLFLNADGGLGINAGPGTAAANLSNGHLVMNASVGFAVHAGATPITSAVSNRLTFTADDQIVLAPTNSFRVFTGGLERFEVEPDGAWQDGAGSTGTLGFVWTCQGASAPPLWAAGGGGGATPAIVSSDHILAADFTLAADEGAIIPRYHQVNSGVTLTLSAGSTFSIAD